MLPLKYLGKILAKRAGPLRASIISSTLLIVFFLYSKHAVSQHSKSYLGSEACQTCHGELYQNFSLSPHSKLLDDKTLPDFHGCEGCHGPGKDHPPLIASGKKGGIVNPSKVPEKRAEEVCGQCHLTNSEKSYKKEWQKIDSKHFKKSEHKRKGVTCLSCHSLHKNKPKLLTLDEREFCFSCHKDKKQNAVSAHSQGKNTSCLSCHAPHGSPKKHHLSQDIDKSCAGCHDVAKEPGRKAHSGFSVKDKNCVSCHNFHPKDKERVKKYQHPPFKNKQCGACHEGSTGALKKDENALCMGCHAGNYKTFTEAKEFVHPPVHEKFCTACHTPHASSYEKLLKDKLSYVCFQCHTKIEELTLSSHKHPPAAEGKCLACHNAKSVTKGEKLIEGGVVNKCNQCHTKQMKFTHPVGENLTIPKIEKKVNVTCASCHQPHGSDFGFIFKSEMADQCRTCHADR